MAISGSPEVIRCLLQPPFSPIRPLLHCLSLFRNVPLFSCSPNSPCLPSQLGWWVYYPPPPPWGHLHHTFKDHLLEARSFVCRKTPWYSTSIHVCLTRSMISSTETCTSQTHTCVLSLHIQSQSYLNEKRKKKCEIFHPQIHNTIQQQNARS